MNTSTIESSRASCGESGTTGRERISSDLAASFAALGEPKRLSILAQLAGGERCACDLTSCCGDRQPLLSFHLKRLREAGLVNARKEGRWMHYTLNRSALVELADALSGLAAEVVEGACCVDESGNGA